MDTNKLTTKSRDAVSTALRNALTTGNPNVEPSHLLHALLLVPGNTVAPLISAVGADPAVVDAAAQGAIAKLPKASGSSVAQRGDGAPDDLPRRRRLRRQEAPAGPQG
jgi:ATP-dependent Clp protease ATP-binding subunit ClpB